MKGNPIRGRPVAPRRPPAATVKTTVIPPKAVKPPAPRVMRTPSTPASIKPKKYFITPQGRAKPSQPPRQPLQFSGSKAPGNPANRGSSGAGGASGGGSGGPPKKGAPILTSYTGFRAKSSTQIPIASGSSSGSSGKGGGGQGKGPTRTPSFTPLWDKMRQNLKPFIPEGATTPPSTEKPIPKPRPGPGGVW